jgi:hypothetical protein
LDEINEKPFFGSSHTSVIDYLMSSVAPSVDLTSLLWAFSLILVSILSTIGTYVANKIFSKIDKKHSKCDDCPYKSFVKDLGVSATEKEGDG